VLSLLFAAAAVAPAAGPVASRTVPFLVFPLLIWTTVRFGQRGATAAAAFVSAVAVACTALGYGPFANGRLQERLWTMQAYMAIIVVTLLVLGAVTEERSRAVNALRRALDAREEFLSIASHELKTPLSSIVLSLSGLQRAFRRGEQAAPDAVTRKVDRAVRQTERLTALIDQLLDVSRISSGKLQLVPEELDLGELTRDVCARFSEEAARSGSTLSVKGAKPIRGKWDRLRIEQVLSNLLSNALRYGGGRPVEVCVEAQGGVARMIVRDQGRGIAADLLPTVFDRFSSAQANTKLGGLGLGLYIARQIVEEHRGTIRATSIVGEGSTFTVELPLSRTVRTDNASNSTSRFTRHQCDTGEEVSGEENRAPAHHDSG
jgi:signal transduction histidine kinase